MKQFMKAAVIALLPIIAATHCQNATDAATEEKSSQTTPANTLTYKLDGTPITLSSIAYTRPAGGGESYIGIHGEGRYINIQTEADLTAGNFDKNSNPAYVLQYGADHNSNGGTANVSFAITVSATEISGTFSGTVRKNDGTILNVTDGSFRVNK